MKLLLSIGLLLSFGAFSAPMAIVGGESSRLYVQAEPPPEGDELVGAWDARDWETGIYRLDMSSGGYTTELTGGATHTNVAGSSWDGGNVARIHPPTTEQSYGGVGSFDIPDVQTLALRWEMRTGSTYASGGQGFVDNKHVIIHIASGDRAMVNLQETGGCLQMAIAQGTTKQFGQSVQGGDPRLERGEDVLFRWCDTASQAGDVVPGDWITISLHVSCENTLDASGHIRAAVWERDGTELADWWIPFDYDPAAECDSITQVEGIGDYYNGSGDGGANTYFDISGVTFGLDQPLLEPRAGFIQ